MVNIFLGILEQVDVCPFAKSVVPDSEHVDVWGLLSFFFFYHVHTREEEKFELMTSVSWYAVLFSAV